ncbi:hypothetical protein C458_01575 [Haloferax sp. ATCC BAA-644]|nr:hypothetical protein C459_15181 [Haloferax sp. ATCC BAA-645]ELZ62087.1 hypothetical protein C460_00155 [Haloferax sp. ATCC BAA-646]ELZ71327.1 hypothetical protein C458_01575 [Haloferax sp. ATCC BAA-644]
MVRATVSELLRFLDRILSTSGDGFGRTELSSELETVFVMTHCDDTLGAESSRRKNATEADCTVTDDDGCVTRFHIRTNGGMVSRCHHVREREKRFENVFVVGIPIGDANECTVGERDTQFLGLCACRAVWA